ncbi:hypothetical protein ACJD0Z_18255 [Flavobacteriaceae bacterium M23B6Z8]
MNDYKTLIENIEVDLYSFKIPEVEEKGIYIFRFMNIYGQVLKKELYLDKNTQEITLCTDEFIDTKEITFLESLTEKDTLSLKYGSSGCFHGFESQIFITKRNNKLKFSWRSTSQDLKEKFITPKEKKYLILFERKLRSSIRYLNQHGNCTTTESYELQLNLHKLFYVDNSCSWYGFHNMIRYILPEEML